MLSFDIFILVLNVYFGTISFNNYFKTKDKVSLGVGILNVFSAFIGVANVINRF